jgi:hypothetical protein
VKKERKLRPKRTLRLSATKFVEEERATLDRTILFERVTLRLYGGKLPAKTRQTLEQIFDYWEKKYPKGDSRWLAYALGTAHHETDRTFGPIREYGRGKGKKYHPYYGRGLVQLTWKYNYEKMSKRLGIPGLSENPDLALEVKNAIPIMFVGMEEGIFTGKKLSDFFSKSTENWVQARRIINGLDRAHLIADYAKQYYGAIGAGNV